MSVLYLQVWTIDGFRELIGKILITGFAWKDNKMKWLRKIKLNIGFFCPLYLLGFRLIFGEGKDDGY